MVISAGAFLVYAVTCVAVIRHATFPVWLGAALAWGAWAAFAFGTWIAFNGRGAIT
jgi:hypothetical protein